MNSQQIDPAAITLPPTQSIDLTAYLSSIGEDPTALKPPSPRHRPSRV